MEAADTGDRPELLISRRGVEPWCSGGRWRRQTEVASPESSPALMISLRLVWHFPAIICKDSGGAWSFLSVGYEVKLLDVTMWPIVTRASRTTTHKMLASGGCLLGQGTFWQVFGGSAGRRRQSGTWNCILWCKQLVGMVDLPRWDSDRRKRSCKSVEKFEKTATKGGFSPRRQQGSSLLLFSSAVSRLLHSTSFSTPMRGPFHD